jgi:hypothetical protein
MAFATNPKKDEIPHWVKKDLDSALRASDPLVPTIVKKHNYVCLYGRAFDLESHPNRIDIEYRCLRDFDVGGKPPPRSPGKYFHLRQAIDLMWNYDGSPARFDWQYYSEKMAEAACASNYLAIAGAASTGKSDFAAVYALTMFAAAPTETLVLLTSTSMKGARGRVWASIKKYHHARPGMYWKLVDSNGIIRFHDPSGKFQGTDQMSIQLIAAEPGKTQEASSKLIGLKNKRVFLIADELSELSEAVLTAADGNLSSNPNFQMIGLSNPKSRFDPFGNLAKPAKGWDSIHIEMEEWKTTRGYCIRLDGAKSPNIVEGRVVYPYLMRQDQWDSKLAQAGARGENSSNFLRMTRGWFPDSVSEEAIFAETDFDYHKAYDKPVWGLERPVKVAGFDPSFTEGGDRCSLVFGDYGKDKENKPTLALTEAIIIADDATKKHIPRNVQIAQSVVDECRKRNVNPRYFAMDTTGGGAVLADLIASLWTNEIHRVQFSQAPSERPMSPLDPTPAKDAVANKVSELWCCAVDYLRAGQFKGITAELARELASRYYHKDSGAKRKVESKLVMKTRCGYSPDLADAFCVMLDLVRHKLRMASQTKSGSPVSANKVWEKKFRKFNADLTSAQLASVLRS